jgi:hypothetical protein
VTKRTETQHRLLELKVRVMSRIANRLFSAKRTGLDGFLKRSMLKPVKGAKTAGP